MRNTQTAKRDGGEKAVVLSTIKCGGFCGKCSNVCGLQAVLQCHPACGAHWSYDTSAKHAV